MLAAHASIAETNAAPSSIDRVVNDAAAVLRAADQVAL
jgi:hypothetical protein